MKIESNTGLLRAKQPMLPLSKQAPHKVGNTSILGSPFNKYLRRRKERYHVKVHRINKRNKYHAQHSKRDLALA